jgi:hypothetical protein
MRDAKAFPNRRTGVSPVGVFNSVDPAFGHAVHGRDGRATGEADGVDAGRSGKFLWAMVPDRRVSLVARGGGDGKMEVCVLQAESECAREAVH